MRFRTSLCLAGVGVCICVAAAFAARTNKDSGSIPTAPVSTSALEPGSIAQPVVTNTRATPEGIRPNLFGDPIPPTPKPVRQAKKPAAAVVTAEALAPPPDPLAKYVVTGILHNDDGAVALLEQRSTKEGRFVHVGEKVEGLEITGIDSQGVHFGDSNAPRLLAMNDKYDLTPLDKDANYLGGRITKHDGESAGEVATALKAGHILLSNKSTAFSFARFGKGEDLEKLNDQAFAGKVPLSEYHERINAAKPQAYQILTFDTVNTIRTSTSDDTVMLKFETATLNEK